MNKLRIPTFILSLIVSIALPILAMLSLFLGAISEALVVAFSLGYASADGEIFALFAKYSLMLGIAFPFGLAATIVGFIRKNNLGLKIASSILYSIAFILLLVLTIMLFVDGFGQLNSAEFGLGLGITALVFTLVYSLGVTFRGFLRFIPEKKKEIINA